MEKRGQLGIIEAKFFFIGLFSGLVIGSVLVKLGGKKMLPWGLSVPFVCGTVLPRDKKGQLIQLEFHFLWIGTVTGIIASWVLIFLSKTKVIPIDLSFLC